MKFQPLNDFILIEEILEEHPKTSLIQMPENLKRKRTLMGIVKAVPSDVKDIHEEDIIFYTQYADKEITFEGKKYLVINRNDLLGVVRE